VKPPVYTAVGFGEVYPPNVCSICKSLVSEGDSDGHTSWHRALVIALGIEDAE
jgi:hypothetical protein